MTLPKKAMQYLLLAYDIAVGQSTINWKGTKKLVEKVHTGTLNFTEAGLEVTDGLLSWAVDS